MSRPQGFPPTGLDRAPRNLRDLISWPCLFGRSEAPARLAVGDA